MSGGAARVLVVEDTPTQAHLARALLVGLGHEVAVAESAGAALVAARDWRPDAIRICLDTRVLQPLSGTLQQTRLVD